MRITDIVIEHAASAAKNVARLGGWENATEVYTRNLIAVLEERGETGGKSVSAWCDLLNQIVCATRYNGKAWMLIHSVYCYNQDGDLVHLFRTEDENEATDLVEKYRDKFETHMIETIV